MKRIILISVFFIYSTYSLAQVGIGTISPNASSVLDIASTDKGILIPQVALGDVADTMLDGVNTAATGLLIYNTNGSVTGGSGVGYYYFNGTTWERLTTSSSETEDIDWYLEGTTIAPSAITDDIYTMGNVAIGTNTADRALDIEDGGIRISKTFNSGIATGIENVLVNNGSGFTVGLQNQITANSSASLWALYNNLTNAGTGSFIGFVNNINSNGSAIHHGITSNIYGDGEGTHMGISASLGGEGNGLQTSLIASIINNGDGLHTGLSTSLSGTGDGDQRGVSTVIGNSGTGWHIGTRNDLSGTSATGNTDGIYNNITRGGSGIINGVRNTLSNGSSTGAKTGVSNTISGSGSTKIGLSTSISGTSTGTQHGVNNSLTTASNVIQYGVNNNVIAASGNDSNTFGSFNTITGEGDGDHYGTTNNLSGEGTGDQYGVNNSLQNTGTGIHYGVFTTLSNENSPALIGNKNTITIGGGGERIGVWNLLTGDDAGDTYGFSSTIGGSNTGNNYGLHNNFGGTSDGFNYGVQNLISVTNNGGMSNTGVYNLIDNSGSSPVYGAQNLLSATGSGESYGVYTTIDGVSAGNKYGSYTTIVNTAGGTHYGVYSDVQKAGSFAGYFNGRVELVSTTDADGTAGTGVLEIANALRIDGNEIITNTNTPLALQYNNNGDLSIDNTTFYVDASTNSVGVGTTTPVDRFEVNGGRVEFTATTDASGVAGTGVLEIANALRFDGNEIITNTDTRLHLQHDNNGDFSVDNTTLFVDASTNRVGIGTTAPGYAFDVVGDINTTGNIRQSGGAYNFPDYVFESYFDGYSTYNSDYKLKSLTEVELFLKENKHLPGVQNREDVKSKGWNVSEGVRTNLEKIEELFLYNIEANKKLTILYKENALLKNQLETQQQEIEEIKALLKKQ